MKLIWTDPSIEDLRAVRDYIGRDSDYYAADVVEQLVLSVERLLRFPKLGRVVPEAHVARVTPFRAGLLPRPFES